MDKHNMDDLDSFLSKVDAINEVITGLNSTDKDVVDQYMHKSDQLIDKNVDVTDEITTRTGFNKTFINKSSDEAGPAMLGMPSVAEGTGQEGFLKIMEQDAKDRFVRKQEARKKADVLKLKGNEQFGLKNFDKALEYYTDAINTLKDNTVIYTNRAQVYIQLQRYQEAIEDCDWSLRVNEKFIKAYIHKGRALTYLKRFDEALAEFERAKECDTASESDKRVVDEYIKELERCRQTDKQERSVQQFLEGQESKENGLAGILDNLNKRRNENILYYSGGLRAIMSMCTDVDQKTLFRIQGGFDLFKSHPVISKVLNRSSIIELDTYELDVLISVFELFQVICSQCDENLKCLVSLVEAKIPEKIVDLVGIDVSMDIEIKAEKKIAIHGLRLYALDLLKVMTSSEFGIQMACSSFDVIKLTTCLLNIDAKGMSAKEAVSLTYKCLESVQNLVMDLKVQARLKGEADLRRFLEDLCTLLKGNEDNLVQAIGFNIVYALTSKASLRVVVVECLSVWIQSLITLTRLASKMTTHSEELLSTVLSLLINLCSQKSESLSRHNLKTVEIVVKFLDIQPDLVLKLIGNIVQMDVANADLYAKLDKNFTLKLIDNIRTKRNVGQSLKALALCTSYSETYCEILLEQDGSVHLLHQLFENVSKEITKANANGTEQGSNVNLKRFNETQINNAVLCMNNCVSQCPARKLATRLAPTDIIMDLLYLTRDGLNKDMQKNCGILIAKLCKSDDKHLIRLRELHGIEILHTALKNCNI